MATAFGDYLRNRRMERGYTLRRFCEKYALSPVDISRIENGFTGAPRSDEELNQLTCCYEIAPDTSEYTVFVELAQQSRNNPPEPLSPDHPDSVKHLPAFCRVAKKSPFTVDDAAELLRLVSGEGHGQ